VDDGAYSEVLRLLERAPKPPEARPPEGATRAELDAMQREIGFPIPASLRRWLALCNGYHAGPGGLFGSRPDYPDLDIAWIADLWSEEWSERWLPIAGDGCGDYYVVDVSVGAPLPDAVYFIDCGYDASQFAYAVGSSIPRFLIFSSKTTSGRSAGRSTRHTCSLATRISRQSILDICRGTGLETTRRRVVRGQRGIPCAPGSGVPEAASLRVMS
jgi:cell wall assembly regulator SMI1